MEKNARDHKYDIQLYILRNSINNKQIYKYRKRTKDYNVQMFFVSLSQTINSHIYRGMYNRHKSTIIGFRSEESLNQN